MQEGMGGGRCVQEGMGGGRCAGGMGGGRCVQEVMGGGRCAGGRRHFQWGGEITVEKGTTDIKHG